MPLLACRTATGSPVVPRRPSRDDRSFSAFLAALYHSQLFRLSLTGTIAFTVAIALDGGLGSTVPYLVAFFVVVFVVSFVLFRRQGRDWFFRYDRW